MKRLSIKPVLSVFTLLVAIHSFAQSSDITVLKYKYYTSYFSTKEHIPIMVEYSLTKDMISCDGKLSRKSEVFKPDPNHKDLTNLDKDYVRSGFDRGHNMSAADNECDTVGLKECFYFSNMTPQPHSFNAGRWEDLEKIERDEASGRGQIIVTVGSVGKASTIGDDQVAVPLQMWKVIYTPSSKAYECYIFPDEDGVDKPLESYKTDLSAIEGTMGVKFTDGEVKYDTQVRAASLSVMAKDNLSNTENQSKMNTPANPLNLLVTILLGAILGAAGQGIRVILGLKKVYDEALNTNKAASDLLEYKQVALSLVIGFGVGAVCGVLAVVGADSPDFSKSEIILFISSGYAGTDFIEGFVKKYPAVASNDSKPQGS